MHASPAHVCVQRLQRQHRALHRTGPHWHQNLPALDVPAQDAEVRHLLDILTVAIVGEWHVRRLVGIAAPVNLEPLQDIAPNERAAKADPAYSHNTLGHDARLATRLEAVTFAQRIAPRILPRIQHQRSVPEHIHAIRDGLVCVPQFL